MRVTISVLNLYTFISTAPCVQRGKCSIKCRKVMMLIEKVKVVSPLIGGSKLWQICLLLFLFGEDAVSEEGG